MSGTSEIAQMHVYANGS